MVVNLSHQNFDYGDSYHWPIGEKPLYIYFQKFKNVVKIRVKQG